MSDDIRRWTAELAADPDSAAFLPLGEALRRRALLEAAFKVARAGVARHAASADAYDLLGRVLSDRGDEAGAFDAWQQALRLLPGHLGASKGLAFLHYRRGDLGLALALLERAAANAPDDAGVAAAIARVRERAALRGGDAPPGAAGGPFVAGDGPALLVDAEGLVLAGDVLRADGTPAGEAAAAEAAAVARDAARTARLLQLGAWEAVSAEGPDGHLQLLPVAETAIVLALPVAGTATGRAMLDAERAARRARRWLETMG